MGEPRLSGWAGDVAISIAVRGSIPKPATAVRIDLNFCHEGFNVHAENITQLFGLRQAGNFISCQFFGLGEYARMKKPPHKRLKVWLLDRDLTQGDFAAGLGISDSHLSKIITGQYLPSAALSDKIHRRTGIRFPTLAKGKKHPLDERVDEMTG